MDGLVLPGGPLGVTPIHMPFEGTITLSPETYIQLVVETGACMAQHGAKYLLILNWHEMNIPPLAIAAEHLHRKHGLTVLTVQTCFVAEELFGKTCGGLTHGGEIEALAVLAYRPDLVHLDRIENSSDPSHGHKVDALRRTRTYQPVLKDVRSIAPTGWYGSPEHATIEKGEKMVNAVADSVAAKSKEIFRELDRIQGGVAEVRKLEKVR
jgi:creatinine amidohydrolase